MLQTICFIKRLTITEKANNEGRKKKNNLEITIDTSKYFQWLYPSSAEGTVDVRDAIGSGGQVTFK